MRKGGSESFWGKCLKRIRVSDNASLSRWEDGGSIYTTVILPWKENGSIYIPTILSKRYLICLAKGSFPGKKVFFGGLYLRENGARKAFGASVLNEFEFMTMHNFKKSRWKDDGSMYTTVVLQSHGRITVVYIYRRLYPKI